MFKPYTAFSSAQANDGGLAGIVTENEGAEGH